MNKKAAWSAVILYTLLIYLTLPIMRPILNYLKGLFGEGFSIFVYIIFVCAGISLFCYIYIIEKINNIGTYIWLGAIAILYVFFIIPLNLPEERIHLLEYGISGYLIYNAVSFNLEGALFYITTLLIIFLIGFIDEGIQWILPNRVFDLRDVWMNCIGGVLGVILTRTVIKR
ncbi:MAG: VanZ family protein [Nitrospirota bacterium]